MGTQALIAPKALSLFMILDDLTSDEQTGN
jgi:hypothetical protein